LILVNFIPGTGGKLLTGPSVVTSVPMSAMMDQVSDLDPQSGGRVALEASTLFRGLDEDSLVGLQQFSELRRVPARDTLYAQGDPGEAVFVLLDGSMKLTRRTGGAREHVVRLVRAGEVLAESVLFSAKVYEATAVALEDSQVLAVDAGSFADQLRRDPHLA
jgi:CRP/FNR family transcriptional regulator